MALFLPLLLLAAGCMATYRMATPFRLPDFEPYDREGTAAVEGTAHIQMRRRRQYAWEREIVLTPATDYSAELIEAYREYPVRIENPDPRLESYQRRTVTDRHGRFRFENLPPGDYFIHCFIDYPTPTGLGPLQRAGAVGWAGAVGRISVGEGQSVHAEVKGARPEQY